MTTTTTTTIPADASWLNVGAPTYTDGEFVLEDGRALNQSILVSAIFRLDWREPAGEYPMMVADALTALVRELRIPRVYAVAYSHELAPYGLLAVRGHYTNGDATIVAIDQGHCITPVVSWLTERNGQ